MVNNTYNTHLLYTQIHALLYQSQVIDVIVITTE